MQQVDRAFVIARRSWEPQVVRDGVLRRCEKPASRLTTCDEIRPSRRLQVSPGAFGGVAVGVTRRVRDNCDIGKGCGGAGKC